MEFLNTLTLPQWLLLGLVPPAIFALYFLKLRREPLQVPSTYLWSRAIEDLHVNSLWQRLRQSLLLLLQLLVILFLIFALVRPGWRGTDIVGLRHIFLIDASASMSATDVGPSRLDEAKKQVTAMIEKLNDVERDKTEVSSSESNRGTAVAMIISFSDTAKVEQPFTDNRRLLRNRVALIQPTSRGSDLTEALRTASGLANPGQSGDANNPLDEKVAEAKPAKLHIVSDGGILTVPDFRLGNLDPRHWQIGSENPANLGITAFSTSRNPDKPGALFIYAQLQNSGPEKKTISTSLFFDDKLVDAKDVEIPGRDLGEPGITGVQFDLEDVEDGVLRLEIDSKDVLPLDNKAFAVVNYARRAKVLLATPGNDALRLALETEEANKLTEVTLVEPAYLQSKGYQDEVVAGKYDLLIYDQCAPQQMPTANTLFIGRLPPEGDWKAAETQGPPRIVDVDQIHPLSQLLAMGTVQIIDCTPLLPPKGSIALMDSNLGVLYAVGARAGFEDAVLGFELVGVKEGKTEVNTNWPIRQSFPVFVLNAVKYLGGVGTSGALANTKPGQPAILRAATGVPEIEVETPSHEKFTIPRESQNTYVFGRTELPGIYQVREGSGKQITQRFAVNLFDSRESDLLPREIEISGEKVKLEAGKQSARKELWRWLLFVALGVLMFEWYIYNRRVYL